MNKLTHLILSLIFGGGLIGCASQYMNLQEPKVELKDVTVKELGVEDAQLQFNFSVNNPNPVEVAVDEIEYSLKLNGKPFTDGILRENLKVGPQSSVVIPLPVSFKYKDFMNSLSDLLKKRKMDYQVDGSLHLGPLAVPYKKSGQFELKE